MKYAAESKNRVATRRSQRTGAVVTLWVKRVHMYTGLLNATILLDNDLWSVQPATDAFQWLPHSAHVVYRHDDARAQTRPCGLDTKKANHLNEPLGGPGPDGGNLVAESDVSGAANVGVPGDPGFATVRQGYLEGSNVDPVKEITELISAQRAYEMNSKVIQAADEMSSTVSKGIR